MQIILLIVGFSAECGVCENVVWERDLWLQGVIKFMTTTTKRWLQTSKIRLILLSVYRFVDRGLNECFSSRLPCMASHQTYLTAGREIAIQSLRQLPVTNIRHYLLRYSLKVPDFCFCVWFPSWVCILIQLYFIWQLEFGIESKALKQMLYL